MFKLLVWNSSNRYQGYTMPSSKRSSTSYQKLDTIILRKPWDLRIIQSASTYHVIFALYHYYWHQETFTTENIHYENTNIKTKNFWFCFLQELSCVWEDWCDELSALSECRGWACKDVFTNDGNDMPFGMYLHVSVWLINGANYSCAPYTSMHCHCSLSGLRIWRTFFGRCIVLELRGHPGFGRGT